MSSPNAPKSFTENTEQVTVPVAASVKADPRMRYNPFVIGISLLFCFPVGLYFVWTHPNWVTKTKWIWTGVWAAVMVFGMIGASQESESRTAGPQRKAVGMSTAQVHEAFKKLKTEKDVQGVFGAGTKTAWEIDSVSHKRHMAEQLAMALHTDANDEGGIEILMRSH